MLNRDQLNNVDVNQAANATMQLIDGIQSLPAHYQVFAITAAFKLFTERFNVDAQSAFSVAHNVMNTNFGRRMEFKGIQLYLENEIKWKQ